MEEKKVVSKNVIVIAVIIAIVIAALLTVMLMNKPRMRDFGTSGKFTEEQLIKESEEIAVLMEEEDYTAILDRSNEDLKKDLASMDWDSAKSTIGDEWGSYQEMTVAEMVEIRSKGVDYAQITVTARYEQVSVDYLLTIGEDGLLAGFRFMATAAAE